MSIGLTVLAAAIPTLMHVIVEACNKTVSAPQLGTVSVGIAASCM